MKRMLILGGSHRDIPLIKASQELGYFVITLGDRDYYLGHNYANKAIKINFNDLDAVKKVIKDENIDYLIPGSGEESYLNTVKLSHELNIGNFDSLETAKLVHNKWKFKKFCLENSIAVPKGFLYNAKNNLDNLAFPVVVKPTNLSGGRGVEIVKNQDELHKVIEKSKIYSDELFLEEFVDGTLIAYSVFLQDQKITYRFIGADETYLNKYLITTAYPINIDEKIEIILKNNIEKLSRLLQLVNGMFHLQVLIKNKIPYIIDVTRRIPGDLYPDLIEYCDGVRYSKAVVQSYLGKKIDKEFNIQKEQNFVIRHCIMPKKNGIYKDIFIDDIIKEKVISKFDLIQKETKIDNFLHTQLAIVFIKLNTKNEFILQNINNLIYPIIINVDTNIN